MAKQKLDDWSRQPHTCGFPVIHDHFHTRAAAALNPLPLHNILKYYDKFIQWQNKNWDEWSRQLHSCGFPVIHDHDLNPLSLLNILRYYDNFI